MDFKLGDGVFPVGTLVKAYPQANQPQSKLPLSGAPVGAVTAEAIVVGGTTISGLTEDTTYVVAAQVGGVWRYVTIRPSSIPVTLEGLATEVAELREQVEALEEP